MSYVIHVVRGSDSGTVAFESGETEVNTTCWWDADVKIDAGTYSGFATRMPSRPDGRGGLNREAIWFGKDIPVNDNSRPSNEIFIHKGRDASWSSGCIVCDGDAVLAIWDAIEPKEEANITIHVCDEAT